MNILRSKKYGRPLLLGLMNHGEQLLKIRLCTESQIKINNAIYDGEESKDIEEYESLDNGFQ